jgi:lipopolysaccharide/colanic/teichoic acid biosynthesis glycosyltransferase
MKRLFDIVLSFLGLLITSPLTLTFMFLIWMQDRHSPFYIAPRVGRNCKMFNMVKLRSMVINADKSGVDSTSAGDKRITWVGRFIRKYKIDELSQLWNVFCGYMSLVGPRPNVERDVSLYTEEEKHLLDVRPGITDLSSIVFSDEGDILADSEDPDLKYNQVIRPWKSRLGLLYIENRSFLLDIKILILTAFAIVSKPVALRGINKILKKLNADPQLIEAALREKPLYPFPPPGSDEIVQSRD